MLPFQKRREKGKRTIWRKSTRARASDQAKAKRSQRDAV